MLGDKRYWGHDNRDPVPTCALDLVVSCRTDPLEGPDTALIADCPINSRLVQSLDHSRGGCPDVVGIGVTSLYDLSWQAMCGEQQTRRLRMTGSRVEHRSNEPHQCSNKARIGWIATHNPLRAIDSAACCCGSPLGKGGSRSSRRELRVERQADDLIGRPMGDLPRGLITGRMPIAHCDETPVGRSQNRFERPRLSLCIGEQRRAATEFRIDLPRHPAPPPCDETSHRRTNERRQPKDGGIAEQVHEKGLYSFKSIRTSQVH